MIRQNRTLIILGFLLFGLMFAVAYLTSEDQKGDGRPSSYSNLRRGAKAAYLLLQQTGFPVERWEKAPQELPEDAQGLLLILADPESTPKSEESAALSRFLLRGGTILATGFLPNSFVPNSAATTATRRVGSVECTPVAPTRLTRGGSISLDGTLMWDPSDRSQMVHFADENDKAVVVSYAAGKGSVIWWASSWPLENAGIREKNNLELLLNSTFGYKRVLWDEYYHADREERASHKPIRASRWALIQLAVIGLAVVLTFSRRSGPLVPLVSQSRLSPLEFVQTLGNVFRRAASAQVAVEIAFQRLRQIAARRLGIRGTSSAVEIVDAMTHRGIRLPEHIAQLVRDSENASGNPELTEKAALEHVRALNAAIQRLDPTSSGTKERT
jgi:uncharacterized protein DUF4350